MSDAESRRRLADIVVNALEVGTGKNERDIIDELFAVFRLDFAVLDRGLRQQTLDRATELRRLAAEQLADAAPTTAALLNAITRCGGRFMAMLDDVYRRLAGHAATMGGTSETVRLRRADVDEEPLTISRAFIEQVRRLSETLTTVDIGLIDEAAVGSFTRLDDGQFYGTWSNGNPVADEVLHLGWIAPAVADHAGWDTAVSALDAATAAAERMVGVAEWLVHAYLTHIDRLGPDIAQSDVFTPEPHNIVSDRDQERLNEEVRRYRDSGVLTASTPSRAVEGIDESIHLGLNRRLVSCNPDFVTWHCCRQVS